MFSYEFRMFVAQILTMCFCIKALKHQRIFLKTSYIVIKTFFAFFATHVSRLGQGKLR